MIFRTRLVVATALLVASGAANAATYYVDPVGGNDGNSGLSTSSPWKRAPGDLQATGGPASVLLKPGDTIRLRAGVPYRGSIRIRASGTSTLPITYSGIGFGTGNAIWDGADPVTSAVPCRNAAECGNASNWANLLLITYAEPPITYRRIYDAQGVLYEAQVPALSDPFYDDDTSSFQSIPASQATAVAAGRLEDATLAAAAAGQPNARLAIWVTPNKVVDRKILSVSGNSIFFDPAGIRPYTDRPTKAAIVGSPNAVNRPGAFANIAPGKAIVWPRPGGGTDYFVGNGRFAFDLRGQSAITIQGIKFVRATSSLVSPREGVAVANYGSTSRYIKILNNQFQHASMQNGYGMIMLNNVATLTISNNRFTDIQGGSGVRLGADVSALLFQNNKMLRIGRTALFMAGVSSAVVQNNVIADVKGVHGNAMTFYQDNQAVSVTGNCVYGATRALTIQGNNTPTQLNSLRFTRNIFISTPKASAAVYSWGAKTRDVDFDSNLMLGNRAGAILNDSDIDVTVTRNRTSGILVYSYQPAGWTIASNIKSGTIDDASRYTLTPDSCVAPGYTGTLTVTPG